MGTAPDSKPAGPVFESGHRRFSIFIFFIFLSWDSHQRAIARMRILIQLLLSEDFLEEDACFLET